MRNLYKLKALQSKAAMLRIAGNLNRARSAKVPLLIIALVAVIGFSMAGCGNVNDPNPGPGPGPGPGPEATFSVSGKFNKSASEEVKFSLSDAGNTARSARSARAVTAESYALSGELEDGDIVFRLSGTYDPEGLSYTASASSSLIRYSINGAFDDDGNSLGSTATLLVRNSPTGDDWSAFSYVIDEAAAVVITGTPTTEVVTGGIPAAAQGWWNFSEEYWSAGSDGSSERYTMDARVLFSQWTIDQQVVTTTHSDGTKDSKSIVASVVEAENKGSYYDVILGYPVYNGTDALARAAALQYLSENNLTAEERDSWPSLSPPWIQEWEARHRPEPLPPWWKSLGSWEGVYNAIINGNPLPAIPPEYQEYAWYYNDYYGTNFESPANPPKLPWLANWNPDPNPGEPQPLPPWLSSFADWDAVEATRYLDIPAIPSQYQQYAFYYNHLYGTNIEWPENPPERPWLANWNQQGDEPLPPWLQSLGSWQAVWNSAKYNIPAIPSQYQEYAWYYNHLYGTDFRTEPQYPPCYIIVDGDVWWGGTFAPNALNKWYNGYFDRYLVALGTVTPDTVYIKWRLSYTSNSVTVGTYYTVIQGQYHDDEESTFDTVAKARAATTINTDYSTTLTR